MVGALYCTGCGFVLHCTSAGGTTTTPHLVGGKMLHCLLEVLYIFISGIKQGMSLLRYTCDLKAANGDQRGKHMADKTLFTYI